MNIDEQKARAALRLQFLETVKALSGRSASLATVEGNIVTGILINLDRDSETLALEQFSTPTGLLPYATVRLKDLDHIKLKRPSNNEN